MPRERVARAGMPMASALRGEWCCLCGPRDPAEKQGMKMPGCQKSMRIPSLRKGNCSRFWFKCIGRDSFFLNVNGILNWSVFDYVICLLGSRAYIYIYMCVFFGWCREGHGGWLWRSSIARNFMGMQTMRCFLFGRYLKPILKHRACQRLFLRMP